MANFIAAAATAVIKWATANAVAQTLVRVAVTVALSAAASALSKNKAGRGVSGIQQQRELGTAVPRQIPVGRCIVAGSEVALWASGDADDNRWNTRVIAIADWPVALKNIIWQGQALTWDGDLSTGWRGCNQFMGKKGRKRLFARFYPGSWNQTADSELIANARAGAPWTSDDRLRGVSYLALRREYDPDAFPSGAPDAAGFRFEVDDAPVFDWRDVTQSATDVTTWMPSRNPVVLAEFGLCHARAPAQFSPGDTSPLVGPGLDWGQRFAALGDRLTAAANICDEIVDGLPRYQAGGVMEGPADAWLPRLADACGGQWVQSAAGSWLRPGYLAAPVYAVAPGALARAEGATFQPWQAPDSAVNTVRAQYVEPANGWQLADLSVSDAALRAADGRELVAQPDLSWVSNRAQANRIIAAMLKLAGQRETRQVAAPFWTCDLEWGDVITLDDPTLPESVWNAWWQVHGVEQRATSEGAGTALSLRRVPTDAYGTPPAAPALPSWTPPNLARALLPPPITARVVAVSGAGTSWNEVEFALADTSVQALGLIEWNGPASANTTGAFEAANARALPLDRAMGATSTGALVPGWYRWRVAGRTATGGSGDWGVWSSGLQITSELVAGSAGGVAWTAVVNKPTEGRGLLSARPASAAVAGSTYEATDTGQLFRWTGSAWVLQSDIALPGVAALVPRINATATGGQALNRDPRFELTGAPDWDLGTTAVRGSLPSGSPSANGAIITPTSFATGFGVGQIAPVLPAAAPGVTYPVGVIPGQTFYVSGQYSATRTVTGTNGFAIATQVDWAGASGYIDSTVVYDPTQTAASVAWRPLGAGHTHTAPAGATSGNIYAQIVATPFGAGNLQHTIYLTDLRWQAVEVGANQTETRTALLIKNQGALATKSVVNLASGEVTNKSLANLDPTANTKLGTVETGADVTTPARVAAGRAELTVAAGSFATTIIECDSAGTPLSGQLPRDVNVVRTVGGTVDTTGQTLTASEIVGHTGSVIDADTYRITAITGNGRVLLTGTKAALATPALEITVLRNLAPASGGALSLSVSRGFVEGGGIGTATYTTETVTVVALGGTGALTHAWTAVSGDTATINGASTATASVSATVTEGTQKGGVFKCTVTDSSTPPKTEQIAVFWGLEAAFPI
jgi:hypothetical protein